MTHFTNGEDPRSSAAAQGVAQRFAPGSAVDAEWWRSFRSPEIDALVKEALANNPGSLASRAALRASQDNLRAGYGIFYPTVDAGASASRERYSPANLGEQLPSSIFNLFTLSTSVGYALDLFGGQRRLLEDQRAQVDVARAADRAADLALVSNLVNTAVAGAAYRAQIAATEQILTLQGQQVALAEVEVAAGTAPYAVVLSLRGQRAATEASLPALQQKLVQSEDLITVLAGHTPAEWQPPRVSLQSLSLPQTLPVSLPSELTRQRPDIRAAEAVAHSASANIGVATAALLPSVTLTGSLQAATNSTANLFPGNGRSWAAGAAAGIPLFSGGTYWFRRRAAIDDYTQAMALYRQTVLAAFEQVADTLRALEHDAAALAADEAAKDDADEALRLIQANYEAGIATYLDVLTADVQCRQALIADLQATAVRYQDTVALFTALGGGWWTATAARGPVIPAAPRP